MQQAQRNHICRIGASVFVAAVLFAQTATIPIMAMHGTFLRSKLFPILEYPMYAPAHYESERVSASWLIEGVLPSGKTLAISKEQLQVDIFDFVNIVQGTMQHDPKATATLRQLVRERVVGSEQLQELRIKNYPMQVTRDGPKALPSEVVMTLPMSPAS